MICKNIVETMEGTIKVDSEEGQGTTFTICLIAKTKIIEIQQDPNNDHGRLDE